MSKVLTDAQLYDIEVAIYNDDNKALFKTLPEGVEDANDEGVIKELAKGQKYYIIPQSNIMVRKDGRLFNVKFMRAIKPMWTPRELLVNLTGQQIRFSEIYPNNGWEFNHRELTLNYKNNNWGITVSRTYRGMYNEYK